MNNRPRRLRDFFDRKPNAKQPLTSRETGELIDDLAETSELDVEGFAREANQSHRRLWHRVEDEIKEDSKRRD